MIKLSRGPAGCLLLLITLSSIIALAHTSDRLFIGRSGLQTTIITGATTTPATYFNNAATAAILDKEKNASFIWYGPGTNAACPSTIRATQAFPLKCPETKAMLEIMADASYNFTLQLNGAKTGSGIKPLEAGKFEYDPDKLGDWPCGTFHFYVGTIATLTVDAVAPGTNCISKPAKLAFAFSQGNCHCDVVGSYYSWTTCGCVTCATTIRGCISCDSSDPSTVTCTSCSTTTGWALVGGVCVCTISPNMPGCLFCVAAGGVCSVCDAINHFQLSAGKCVCASGYALKNGVCVTCSTVLSNCQTCSSNSTCTGCISTSYALVAGVCQLCSVSLPNCLTCTSQTTCVACVSNTYALLSAHCVTCASQMAGCLTCSSATSCTTCNAAGFFTKTGGNCVCSSGYALTGSTCSTCASQMTGCSTCTSATVCTICNLAGHFVTNGANGCKCGSGYALSGSSCVTCATILPGCTACSSNVTCTTCDPALHLTVGTSGACECASGYIDMLGTCTLCSTPIPNCVTCSTSATCTTCLTSYGVDALGNCVSCSLTYNLKCTACGPGGCTACDTTLGFMLDASKNCVCNVPYTVYDNIGSCVPCSPTLLGCLQCSDLATCTLCAPGYYDTGANSCLPCLSGCAVCTDGLSCTTCDTHYAQIDIWTCDPCGNSIAGCVTCSSSPILSCTACNPLLHLVQSSGSCVCDVGYFSNGVSCMTCGSAITNCQECTDSLSPVCTYCSITQPVAIDFGTNTCNCLPGYALDSLNNCLVCDSFALMTSCVQCTNNNTCTLCTTGNGVNTGTGYCQSCGLLITNCATCVTSAACSVCNTGFAIATDGSCQPCSSFTPQLTNCVQCSSNSTCTLCTAPSFMVDSGSGTCKPCSAMMVGCQTCDSSTNCLICDAANNFIPGGTGCVCASPYLFQTSSSTCQPCSTLQPLCNICSTESTCMLCNDGNYLDGANVCVVCPAGCANCTSPTSCDSCDTVNHFVLNVSACNCDIGYSLNGGGVCATVCGDGIVASTEACDDGNLVNGDGCDSICFVETNFSCFAFPSQPSTCSYNKPLTLNLNSVVKTPGSNSISFNLNIGPNLPNLNTLNFSELFQTSVPLQNPRFVLTPTGELTLTYDYNQTLEGAPISLTFLPAAGSQAFFAVPASVVTFPLIDANNTPIAFYNETVYEQKQQFDTAYKGGVGSAYAIMAVGMACDKVIGVELMGVWQVAYLSLSNIDRVQPLLEPLMKLGLVNGINSQLDFNTTEVPRRVSAINYEAEFLSNVNYMLYVVVADIVIGAIVYLTASLVPKYKEKMQEVGLRMLKEYLLMLILFNTFNIAYSAGLQFTYCETMVSLNGAAAAASLLLPLAGALAVTLTNPAQFGEFKSHYRPDGMSQSYFVWTIVYRTLLGVCMSQMNELEQATIVNFSVAVLFLLYLMTNTPYVNGYQNYRAIADQIAIMVSLFTAMYYRSMKSTTDPASVSQILMPAYISIISMYGATAISAATLGYELYLKFRPSTPKNQKLSSESNDMMENPTQNNIDSNEVMENALNQYP